MTNNDDRLLQRLAELDPTRTDVVPTRGSARYASIQENAIQSIHDQLTNGSHERPPTISHVGRVPRGRSRRGWAFGAAAAAVIATVVGFSVLQPGRVPDASAAVRAAAVNTGDVGSLRGAITVEYADGRSLIGSLEVNGPDGHFDIQERSPDGSVHGESYTIVGDTIWTTSDGVTTSAPARPNDRLTPFAEASEAVVTAALQGAEVTDLGTETLGDSPATRYRIELDDTSRAALGSLAPSELAWFELEYPEQVTTIDLWVSDELVRKIRVESELCTPACNVSSTSTTEFFDLGAEISIQPPA